MIGYVLIALFIFEVAKYLIVLGAAYVWNWHRERKAKRLIKMSDELFKDLKKQE